MRIDYYMIDPTGNKTILVSTPTAPSDQVRIAEELMWQERSAEQVGFVRAPKAGEDVDTVLRMAGGEFCGNATMSAAALFCDERGLDCENERLVRIKTSGAEQPLTVGITRIGQHQYKGTVTMPKPGMLRDAELEYCGETYRLPALSFDGITHLIMEYESVCPISRPMAEAAIKEWCNELGCDGLGLMMYDPAIGRLDPLVYVKEPETLFWESSCASGTTATGVYLARKLGHAIKCDMKEPGGVLTIEATPGEQPKLTGTVRIERAVSL